MKGIITNAEKSLGLILPGDKDTIVPIGRFSLDLLYAQLEALEAFSAFNTDSTVKQFIAITVATMKNQQGESLLLIRPDSTGGEGWIALCPRIEVEGP
jgi:hypothetical protein